MSFAAATTARKISPGVYVHQIPDGWQQGPGAYGGFVLALLARTALDFEGDASRPFRSLSGAVLAPVVTAEARLTARLLRRGTGLSAVNVQLEQNGQIAATADVVMARSRVSDGDWQVLVSPALPAWEQVGAIGLQGPSPAPFAAHFEYRAVEPLPFTGADVAQVLGWIRARDPGGPCDVPLLIGLIDAWWPAPFSRFKAPRPMGTVAFALQVLIDPSTLDPREPLAYRSSSPAAAGGYALELRELFTRDGRAVAHNQQTFAMIK
jgi:hypothetical protein